MALAALLIGLLIALQGVLGIAAPELFVRIVRFFQDPPVIYLAAVLRIVFGVVLVRAAPASRVPGVLRLLGFLIAIGGVLTPFVGVRFAHAILDSWSAGGNALVRMWAGGSLVLGVLIVYAVVRNRRAEPLK